jgi:type II secretory pathway pseudopilin PulG
MSARRSGMVMLEVILGVAILGMAGVALVTLLTQTLHTVRQGRASERRTESAARLLSRATLWNDAELASRLGKSRIGDWSLEVARTQPGLYTLAVLDTLAGAPVLRTSVYRP